MPNKLRAYSTLLGGGLVAASIWAGVEYGARPGTLWGFAQATAVGLGVVLAPIAFAYAKLALERRRHAGLGRDAYVSPPLGLDRASFLVDVREGFESNEDFVGVKERAFPEGSGLLVEHTGFHGTFVRLSTAGRIVVTGVRSRVTRSVVDELEALYSTSLSSTSSNPFIGPIPVRGAPRVLLAVLLTAVAVANVALIADTAYPTSTYNPGEKAVLVGYDFQEWIDPGTSETDARLAKAEFLVSVLTEEATEVRWEAGLNASRSVPENNADAISADITRLLDQARASDPDEAQRARIRRIEADHERAREVVRIAVAETANATDRTPGGPTGASPSFASDSPGAPSPADTLLGLDP